MHLILTICNHTDYDSRARYEVAALARRVGENGLPLWREREWGG